MIRKETPRLGRGLAALIQPSASAGAIKPLPIEQLEPGPFQPRQLFAPEPFAELVESIRAQGILQPILVRAHPTIPQRYQIIAGERRWRAAQEAGLHEVPALIRDLSDADAMAASLVENLQRQDLNPIEEGEGYRRLLEEFGLTQENLGDIVGKSRSHVANIMRLLQLPESVRSHLKDGGLSAGHARALLSHPDPEKGALHVIAKGLNVRQTEKLVRDGLQPQAAKAKRAADPDIEAVSRTLSAHLGLKVEIGFDGKGGQLRINYKSLDQLEGLIALLNPPG